MLGDFSPRERSQVENQGPIGISALRRCCFPFPPTTTTAPPSLKQRTSTSTTIRTTSPPTHQNREHRDCLLQLVSILLIDTIYYNFETWAATDPIRRTACRSPPPLHPLQCCHCIIHAPITPDAVSYLGSTYVLVLTWLQNRFLGTWGNLGGHS
jgi:hypothetical protein